MFVQRCIHLLNQVACSFKKDVNCVLSIVSCSGFVFLPLTKPYTIGAKRLHGVQKHSTGGGCAGSLSVDDDPAREQCLICSSTSHVPDEAVWRNFELIRIFLPN